MKVNKSFYKSKTMWAAILTAVIPAIFPAAAELVKLHPEYIMGAVGVIFGLLRIDTNSAVVIKSKSLL